ncbi:hypothetical protein WNY37_10730 [Henriciella sp. AS95]|uniref:hypothetical protein n=1 Tax=Henriciella sp. AS95 TaxID=3135782 RepID=UPI00317D03AC
MFKRPRLSAQTLPVNAGIAGFLLFYAASCSGPQEPEPEEPSIQENSAVEQEVEIETATDTLPAVWSTDSLDLPVRSIGIAGGAGSTFALAYEGGGLQLFNFDGERITDIADSDVAALAEGRYALLADTPVTFFPGIDGSGDLKIWIHGGGLQEAIPYAFQIEQSGRAEGLCAAPPIAGTDALHRLAYWTAGSTTLMVGDINESGGELVWSPTEEIETDGTIGACTFTADGVEVYDTPIMATSTLRRMGRETLLTLSDAGTLTAIFENGQSQALNIEDGITIRMPDVPTSLAATGDARGGGYPGGVIVMGGTIGSDDHRAILIDPSRITLTPISIPPGGQ